MDSNVVDQWIEALTAEENALVDRLARVRAARAALSVLQMDGPVETPKLADACRDVLKRNSSRSFSPLEVRDALNAAGFDTENYPGNLMAAIHGVLKRLAESGDVKRKDAKDGTSVRYTWTGSREISSPDSRLSDLMTGQYRNTLKAIEAANAAININPDTLRELEKMDATMKRALAKLPQIEDVLGIKPKK